MSTFVPRPKYLTTPNAVAYTGKSRYALARATEAGQISPVGRCGRTLTWSIDDLDRWMSGQSSGSIPVPAVAARRAPANRDSALERIKRTAQHRGAVVP